MSDEEPFDGTVDIRKNQMLFTWLLAVGLTGDGTSFAEALTDAAVDVRDILRTTWKGERFPLVDDQERESYFERDASTGRLILVVEFKGDPDPDNVIRVDFSPPHQDS